MSVDISNSSIILPTWPAPENVKAFTSTRIGGISDEPYDSLNLGAHVGDDLEKVKQNRRLFAKVTSMPSSLRWLNQVHGIQVAELPSPYMGDLKADAVFSRTKEHVCAVMVADCLPLLMCNKRGNEVAACHAGWRGLCDGVIEQTIAKFSDPTELLVWLGPAIGAQKFEVGEEVKDAFLHKHNAAEKAFKSAEKDGKWLADLYLLARQRLAQCGVTQIYGGDYCTYTDEDRFFSYRREGVTGRMASVIWLEEAAL